MNMPIEFVNQSTMTLIAQYRTVKVKVKVKVKVNFTLEQATKAQSGSRGIALLFP
jgi:hypothetical protein